MLAQQVVEVETVILSIHAGTVNIVPALTDTEPYEVPVEEIEYNAPTPVSRERFCPRQLIPLCMTPKQHNSSYSSS